MVSHLASKRMIDTNLFSLEDIGEMTMPLSSILSGNSRLIGERWYPTSMNGQMVGSDSVISSKQTDTWSRLEKFV